METRVGPQTPYEVYCYGCRVTFPVGTQSCVHCGRPIGAMAPAHGVQPIVPGASDRVGRLELPAGLNARRFGGMSLWVLLALAGVISRMCAGS